MMETAKKIFKNWIGFIILWIVLFLITTFVININIIPSSSMEPLLKEGDIVISTCYDKNDINRYDIITFHSPDDNKTLIKRVIGLPGDVIEIIPDTDAGVSHVYINGESSDESFILEPTILCEYQKYEVPEESYFCLGDNRNNSIDSRYLSTPYISSKSVISIYKIKIINIYLK